jgi:hypothetical protein
MTVDGHVAGGFEGVAEAFELAALHDARAEGDAVRRLRPAAPRLSAPSSRGPSASARR